MLSEDDQGSDKHLCSIKHHKLVCATGLVHLAGFKGSQVQWMTDRPFNVLHSATSYVSYEDAVASLGIHPISLIEGKASGLIETITLGRRGHRGKVYAATVNAFVSRPSSKMNHAEVILDDAASAAVGVSARHPGITRLATQPGSMEPPLHVSWVCAVAKALNIANLVASVVKLLPHTRVWVHLINSLDGRRCAPSCVPLIFVLFRETVVLGSARLQEHALGCFPVV